MNHFCSLFQVVALFTITLLALLAAYAKRAPDAFPSEVLSLLPVSTAPPWARAHCAATMSALRDAKPAAEWPPPCPLPPERRRDFEFAKMPFGRDWCIAQRYEGTQNLSWSADYIDGLRRDLRSGKSTGTYGAEEVAAVGKSLRSLPTPVEGAVALVMGTEIPWVEALLLNEGAALVWTFEYSRISVFHPRMRAKLSQTIAAEVLQGLFAPVDLIVSFSSLEHSGLGRYGDQLDPDGDRKAIAQAWCMLRPGGLLVLGFLMTCADEGAIAFNAHRVYGFARLAYVTSNFELVGFPVGCKAGSQPLVVLRKPEVLAEQAPADLSSSDFEYAALAASAR
jgi:hypothetical protein